MNDLSNNSEEITALLHKACREGNSEALNKLYLVVLQELRKLARSQLRRERPNHTLQTDALVDEACMKLLNQRADWRNRAHFFGIAAQSMRRILMNHAREKRSLKRGGKIPDLSLDEAEYIQIDEKDDRLIALDDALNKLSKFDERMVQIVEMHHFMDLTIEETAKSLNISPAKVKREWNAAKAWLHREIKG